MMKSDRPFLLKVLLASATISIAIKYGGPLLDLPATPAVAITLVFLPPGILAIALFWRMAHNRSSSTGS